MSESSTGSGKLYYPIGEVAKMLGENVSCIRHWTQQFDSFVKPHTNKKGDRFYTEKDIKTLKTIHYLVRECKLQLAGAKAKLEAARYTPQVTEMPETDSETKEAAEPALKESLGTRAEVVSRLREIRQTLEDIKSYL